jgi:hypothetical protein
MMRRAKAALLFPLLAACALLGTPADAQTTTDVRPSVYKVVLPVYPTMINTGSGEIDQDGLVIVEARLDEAGRVSAAKPSVQAAQQWEFAPAEEGAGVRTVTLYFNFKTLSLSEPESSLHPRIRLSPKYWVEVSRYSVKEVRASRSGKRRSKRQPK